MTQASGINYRPDFPAYRGQLIASLGRMGLGQRPCHAVLPCSILTNCLTALLIYRPASAAARERQCTGSTMTANGTMSEYPALNVAVRREWAAAGVGVVDLCYGSLTTCRMLSFVMLPGFCAQLRQLRTCIWTETDDWMGAEPGASVVANLSAYALKWRKLATEYPARQAWQGKHSYIELFNEIDTGSKPGTGDQYMAAAQSAASDSDRM